ncbi:hypothetical protein BRD05_05160 [Halobacteriales archaeon QS_9_70_65]|nr:MAG: hypothetical protein BRD05_05160 [Halobacteriales archaeon QS_9_70_65]
MGFVVIAIRGLVPGKLLFCVVSVIEYSDWVDTDEMCMFEAEVKLGPSGFAVAEASADVFSSLFFSQKILN